MAGVADSAVGAILEIPPQALGKIKEAENAIKKLQAVSAEAAGNVNLHWGEVATNGLQKFIDKIADAKARMDGLGTINVTLNTQAAVRSTEQLSSATQKTSVDVSKAVQDMAQSWNDLAKVNLKDFNITDYGNNLTEILLKLKDLKKDLKNEPVGSKNSQWIADEIRRVEEWISLYKKAAEEKNKALSNIQQRQQQQTDKAYLDEQKRLLAEILDLRKQVNGQKIVVAQGQVTGSSTLEQDKKILSDLITRLYEAKDKLKEYNAEKYKNVSAEGQAKAQVNTLNQENALIKEQMSFREKLNSAIARGNELVAQTQAGKARLGSSDESVAQRQLNSDYKEMLKIIKEQGEIKAKVASEGRQMNQDEINLIATLAQRYRTYYDDIKRIEGAYANMAQASAQAFQNDKSAQMSRNAVLLADAQNKAAEAAQKVADAQAKAAQQQASKDRSQAESDLNRLYTERLRLLKEKEQLENKAIVNTAKGLPDLTAKENQLLTEVTAKIATIENQISTIGQSYAGLAAKTKQAFALDELRQATDLQNQFNKALDAVDTSRTKQLVAEYKRLYAENEKLIAAIDQYNSKIAGIRPIGDATSTVNAANNLANRQAEVARQMAEIERKNIQEIADFRQQKEMEANQRSISEFIQAEAQKKAEAQKTVNEQITQAKIAGQQYAQSFAGAMAQYNNMMSGNAGGKLAMNLENVKRVLNDLKTAAGKLNILDPADEAKAKQLKAAIEELNRVVKQYKQVTDSSTTKPVISPQDAINMAKSATTLRELENAYKALKEAMANTKASDPQWAAMNAQLQKTKTTIDEIKKKMGELQSQAQKTSNIMGQLQGRIAAAFSVGAITGFIKKMVDVRAQFELQRVALGAIIQDRDEANKIFTQVQNMALESPFNIMQLEKATKQIAAFGFETQKLVPTMKMFADISAGLGVEIDRLVLVMGHLKARNFLEGTMVRQFTNMGFNVLGELSKYYTELEGKMVSVGEVQDRVKKKMVSFEDVEEVLKRVTSAGGMFYDMQKKQSESLWGQMQRIQDAYDLMLNEIGQSNEGILKSALSTIRNLINHWRDLKPVIVATVAAMGAYFTTALALKGIPLIIGNIANGFRAIKAVITSATIANNGLNASLMKNPWGALLGIITAVGVALYEVFTTQSRLNEELERIEEEGLGNMYNLIFKYRELADAVQDYNKTYEERKEAMDEMKRVYGEILPDQMLEIDNIKKMKDGYNEATEAIKAHYEEKIKRQKEEAIKGDYEKKIKEQVESAAERFKLLTYDAVTEGMGLENIPEDTYQRNIENILTAITKEVEDGITPAEEASKRFKEVLMQNLAMSDADYKKISQSIDLNKAFEDAFSHQEYHGNRFGMGYFIENSILSTLQDMNDKIKEESESILGNLNAFMAPEAEPYVKQYELLTQAVGEYKKAIEALFNLQSEGNLYDKDGKLTKDAEYVYNELNGWIEKINESGKIFGLNFQPTSEDVNNAIQSNIDKMEYFERVNVLTFGHVTESFDTWGAKLKNNTFLSGLVENWRKAWQQLNLSDEQREIRNLIKTVGELNNVDLSKYKWALIDSKDNVASVAKEVKSEVESLKTSIQKYQTAVAAGLPAMIASAFFLGGKTLEEVQQTLKAVDELSHKLGNADKATKKSGGKGSDKELKRWQDLKKAIEDVSTAYDKYRKSFSVEEANKRIEELFGATFKELGSDIKQFYKDGKYDADAMIDALEVLLGLTKANTEERKKFRSEIQRKIGTTEMEIEVKMQEDAEKKLKQQIDDMFASYELTKELKGLGVPVDLIFMLGGQPIDLESLKNKLQYDFEAIGGKSAAKDKVKIYEDAFKKIADLENKQRQQQLKNYIKYLTESIGERAQIEIKAMRDINKIQEDANLDAFSKEQAIMQRRKKMHEELTKYDLDQLKSSDVYLSVFKDLENASKEQLQYVINKLKEMQSAFSDLSPAQVKSIANDLKKMEDALAGKDSVKNMFGNLKDAIEYAKKRKDLLKEQVDWQEKIDKKTKELGDAEKELIRLAEARDSIQDKASDEWQDANKAVEEQQILVMDLNADISHLQDNLTETTNEIEKGELAWAGWKKGIASVHEKVMQVKESLDSVFDGLDSMGLVNDAFRDTYESIGEIIGGLDTFMSGLESIDIMKPFSIITGGIKAVGGIFQTIGAAFGIGDKKKERQIQSLADKVDELDKAYQKLEKSIDSAYTFSQYNAEFDRAKQNLEEQKKAYQEMMALEEAKKKTDKDKIKEYQDKLDDIAEKEEELRKQRIEAMGSTTDYLSEAQSFVDAWLNAYKETGSGLDALSESWDEFIENLFVKQGAAQIVSARLKKVIDDVNAAIEAGGTDFDLSDAVNKAREDWKKEAEIIEPLLEQLFGSYGLGKGNGDFILSDLQKGIQNITEPQAAAIEAYLNSMRFAVFRHTEQLDTLIATIQMQYGSGAENPVVTELKGIRGVLDNIDRRLASVINTQGRNATLRIGT